MTKSRKARPQAKKMGGRKIKGKGDYKTFNLRGMAQKLDQALSSIPKGTFAKKGAQMGAKYGPLGALAGKGLGAGLAAVTGYGNYSVRSNSLSRMSTSVDMIPQFVKNDHSIRVVHREFVKDLVVPNSPSTFSIESFLINPANATLFPWLATMARQYSQYKIHGMVFAYKTMSSDITAGGALGTVIMATNYNSIDRAFQSKIEMENSEFAVSTKPSMSLVHAIECDPKYSGLDVLYIRDPSYETADTNDRRFYDYGRFQLATTGLPGTAGATMGEIWVSYDIEFMKPVLGGTGLPTYVLGKTITSRVDGGVSVTSSSRVTRITYTDTALSPSASTVTSVLPATPTVGGDVGLNGTVISVATSGRIDLLKDGSYVIKILGTAPTTATAFALATVSTSSVIALPYTVTGSAAATVTSQGCTVLPQVCSNAVSATGYQYCVSYAVLVTGITGSLGTVRLTPSTFTTHNTALVANWVRSLDIEWASFGSNLQDQAYVRTNE